MRCSNIGNRHILARQCEAWQLSRQEQEQQQAKEAAAKAERLRKQAEAIARDQEREQWEAEQYATHADVIQQIEALDLGCWIRGDKWVISTRNKIEAGIPLGELRVDHPVVIQQRQAYEAYCDKFNNALKAHEQQVKAELQARRAACPWLPAGQKTATSPGGYTVFAGLGLGAKSVYVSLLGRRQKALERYTFDLTDPEGERCFEALAAGKKYTPKPKKKKK